MLVQDSRAHLAREPNNTRCKSVGGSEGATPSSNGMSFPACVVSDKAEDHHNQEKRVLQIVATVRT
jgi:hypothetical protein